MCSTTERLSVLQQQIGLVKQEHARLTQGEWALLMMLEQVVLVLEAELAVWEDAQARLARMEERE